MSIRFNDLPVTNFVDEENGVVRLGKRALVELYDSAGSGALVEEAKAFGITTETLSRQIRNYKQLHRQIMGEKIAEIKLPESPSQLLTDYTILEADDAIVISDIEIPDHNPEILHLALLTAMRYNIKRLIVAGDYMATDQASLNSWVNRWVTQSDLTYQNALSIGADIIHQMLKWFDHIDFIEGNHDDRIARATKGEVFLGMLLKHERITYSRYEYMYMVTSNRGIIKICHPENFSSNPVSLGKQLYNKETGPYPSKPAKCHIVLAHTHILESGWTVDAAYEVHALGTCRDSLRTRYKQKSANKHNQWIPGFLMIKNGFFRNFSQYGTDWQDVLGEYYEYKNPEFSQIELLRA